jgi:CRISPR-associated protein Cas5d
MTQTPVRLFLRASGSLACFTRPECSVERVSYPWITPSAARSLFEAVIWKPRIRWEIREIRVLKPIRFIALRRNEIGCVINGKDAAAGVRIATDDERQQRNTLALAEVDYVIGADLWLRDEVNASGADDNHGKYSDMFMRRLEGGQVFHRPYLGCREFAADVRPPTGEEVPVPIDMDHGPMLYDFNFPVDYRKTKEGSHRWRGGQARPILFSANLVQGTVAVPPRSEIAGAMT